jgi:hypothetical protein
MLHQFHTPHFLVVEQLGKRSLDEASDRLGPSSLRVVSHFATLKLTTLSAPETAILSKVEAFEAESQTELLPAVLLLSPPLTAPAPRRPSPQ